MHSADEPLDRDIVAALDALDYPIQRTSVDSIIQEARARERQRRWRLAAAAAVMLSAVGVAALPISPVRHWIAAALRGITTQQRDKLAGDAAGTSPAPEMRGVSTEVGASTELSFSDWQESGEIVLRLISESEMRIRSPEFPGSYSVRTGNIIVQNPGSRASYDVEVSGRANITVTIGGQVVFKRQDAVVTLGPPARSDSVFVLSLEAREKR